MMTQPTRPQIISIRFENVITQWIGQRWIIQVIKYIPFIQTLKFRRAVRQAYLRFADEHPEWVASLFDEHFLSQLTPHLEAQYRTEGTLPSPMALAIAWDEQVGPASAEIRQQRISDVTPAAADFINWLAHALDE